VVQRALATGAIRMMNTVQAEAISKRLPELANVVLSRGLISLERDEPSENTQLLATSNSLLVRKDPRSHLALLRTRLEAAR
jgi:hypothetical protein